jgi:predicted phage gp36 major capsid-like protein
MKQKQLEREQANTLENIAKAKEAAAAAAQAAGAGAAAAAAPTAAVGQKRRNRWDQSGDEM